jgi:putative transposase
LSFPAFRITSSSVATAANAHSLKTVTMRCISICWRKLPEQAHTEIWSYCLMPNHVHIIAVPSYEDGLRRTFRYAHHHYIGYINARLSRIGHFWQRRFSSVVMDEENLHQAFRYVALNPVRGAIGKAARRLALVQSECTLCRGHMVNVASALVRNRRLPRTPW